LIIFRAYYLYFFLYFETQLSSHLLPYEVYNYLFQLVQFSFLQYIYVFYIYFITSIMRSNNNETSNS